MAFLPTYRRVLKEDLRDSPEWMTRFLTPYNSFSEAVYTALSGNLSFGENIRGITKEITFETLATYSGGDFTMLHFKNTMAVKATGCQILQIYANQSPYVPIKKATSLDWLDVNGEIQINFISGLENSTPYFLRVRVT